MNKKVYFGTLIFLMIFFLSACKNGEIATDNPTEISVISLRENLPKLTEEAKKWQDEAYLIWAEIPIWLNSTGNSTLIAAAFNSPEMELEGVLVELNADGSITMKVVEQSIPIYQQEPITEEDWTIDSQEALKLMLDREGEQFLLSHPESQSSFLTLERKLSDPEEPLVWRLTLTEFLGETTRHILMDPITGEILEDS
jgi:hypothetical protein